MDENRDFTIEQYEALLKENRRLAEENKELRESLNNRADDSLDMKDFPYTVN